MEVAYYPGCTLHASSEMYDVQSKLVFKNLGIDLREIEDWNCCGATSASKTDEFLAVALPARNLGIADASGFSEMFIPCSSCLSRTLVSQKTLADNPALKDRINSELKKKVQGKTRIVSILEMLVPMAESGEIAKKTKVKLEGLKPACYYGCLLTRFPSDIAVPDNVENPQGMETVCRAVGAEPVEWGYKTDCCGASASVNDTDVALNLMSKITRDAVARGANCFVTTCPMCQLNMDAYQDRVAERYGIGERLPVYFITELLGVAMGINLSKLQIDRHFVEATGLLKELKLT
ncbi:MAG TPA: CoB--CoM heterodisulfide reductase iron-sulfur subunit B family protein [Dissulfurispiraceae bacterium]|nr:CoB--CoM heterodisulfide reductase iron-sulfur subunit B family protein [Dissulfurispiraceae bacterium]